MADWIRKHGASLLAAMAVAALVAYAYVVRIRFLAASPYPLGIDGYYYPIQIRSLLEEGHLYYPSAPLVLWLMAPVGWATDAIFGAKIVAAAGTALAAVPAYLLGKRITESRPAGVLAAALAATSAQSFYLATEFVKQGVGLTVTLAFLAALAAALERPSWARAALAAVFLVACGLTHKVALGIAVGIGIPAAVHFAWKRGHYRILVALGALVVLLAGAVFVLGALAPKRYVSPHDLGLLGGMFTLELDWSFAALVPRRGAPLVFRHEVLQGAIAALIATSLGVLAWRLRGRAAAFARVPSLSPLAWGFVALALLLALPFIDVRDEQAMGMRVRLTAWIVVVALAPLVVVQLWRLTEPLRLDPRVADAAIVAFALALPLALPSRSREGVVTTHPALATAVHALDGVVPPGGRVVTPERHVLYMATWYARTPAFLRTKADADPATRYRLIPGAHIDKDLRAALDSLRANPPPGAVPPRDLHPFDENGLVLVTEGTWQTLVAGLPPASRERWELWKIQ